MLKEGDGIMHLGSYRERIFFCRAFWYVPEVLNVHMNEIYQKLTTIK